MSTPKQRAIADEFGLPFWDVVKGFADDGLSISGTASVLGYSHCGLITLVERHKVRHWFKVKHKSAFWREAHAANAKRNTPAQLANLRRMRQLAAATYAQIDYQGVTATLAGHAKRLGLSRHTVYKRNRARQCDWDYVFSLEHHQPERKRDTGWHKNSFRFGKTRTTSQ